jgi:crossover junction endodeoxyribonuclease RuvC
VDRTTRILGIDPGSQITGFGVVDLAGRSSVAVEWGSIRTSGDHGGRLKQIFLALGRVVQRLNPDEIAIEKVFVHRNADSALKLGQARAAALCATFDAALPVYEYSARHIKKAVVGRGGADKSQVQHMVRLLLGLREELQPDAADALAAALCHAYQRDTQAVLDGVAGRA